MKTFLECMNEAAEQIGWLKGEHFIEQLRGTQIDVLNKAADIYEQTRNSNKPVVGGKQEIILFVEKELNPEYMNDVFSWRQIEVALQNYLSACGKPEGVAAPQSAEEKSGIAQT